MRVETPHPATPEAIVTAIVNLVSTLAPYERVSVGFPASSWARDPHRAEPRPKLEELRASRVARAPLEASVRVLNDAGVQGYGVIDGIGVGVEMVLTFGTGMGTALYIDGRYVPNLELAHHPFKGKKTYEDYVRNAVLREDRQEEVEQAGSPR